MGSHRMTGVSSYSLHIAENTPETVLSTRFTNTTVLAICSAGGDLDTNEARVTTRKQRAAGVAGALVIAH